MGIITNDLISYPQSAFAELTWTDSVAHGRLCGYGIHSWHGLALFANSEGNPYYSVVVHFLRRLDRENTEDIVLVRLVNEDVRSPILIEDCVFHLSTGRNVFAECRVLGNNGSENL